MQCPKCNHIVADDATFCPVCGGDLTAPAPAAAPFCGACGAPLTGDAKFCPVCGKTVDAVPAPGADAEPVAEAAPTVEPAPESQPAAASIQQPTPPPVSTYSQTAPAYAPPASEPASEPAPAPAVTWLREVSGSPLLVISAVLYTIVAGFSLFIGLTSLVALIPYLAHMEGEAAFLLVFLLLYAFIPAVLTTVGLWVLFGTTRGSKATLPTVGLTTLSVASVVTMVMQIILFGFLAWMMCKGAYYSYPYSYSYSYSYSYRSDPAAAYAILLVLVLFGLCLTPAVIYRAKVIAMNTGAARAARQGGLPPIPSDYAGVLLVFSGVACLVLLAAVFLPMQAMLNDSPYSAVTMPTLPYLLMVLGGVSNILLGILVRVARKKWIRQMVG